MAEKKRIAIVGDGGWGTAMALVLEASGHEVAIWGHDPGYLREMRETRVNRLFLPAVVIPAAVEFRPDLEKALAWSDLVITAVPSKFLRMVLSGARGALDPETPVVSLTKGLDPDTLERPSEVVRECLDARHIVAISGPSHAEEVAKFLPASVVAAAEELETARRVQRIVSTSRLRVYASGDLIGVELGGAIKNVIALAAGIIHGMGLGDNALSALVTRGLAEMTRLGVAMGGDAATFAGLAGLGDLVTTCISPHGRNRQVGLLLAGGKSLREILDGMNGIPESVTTTSLALSLAKRHGVEMPITQQVAAVLWEGKSPEAALDELMNRAKKDED